MSALTKRLSSSLNAVVSVNACEPYCGGGNTNPLVAVTCTVLLHQCFLALHFTERHCFFMICAHVLDGLDGDG